MGIPFSRRPFRIVVNHCHERPTALAVRRPEGQCLFLAVPARAGDGAGARCPAAPGAGSAGPRAASASARRVPWTRKRPASRPGCIPRPGRSDAARPRPAAGSAAARRGTGPRPRIRTGCAQARSGSCRSMVRSAIDASATSAISSFACWRRGPLDIGLAGLGAGVGRAVLARPGADQDGAHRVGAAGQVGQDMRPGPARQQGRLPQVRLGDHPGRAEQPLRRVVDLVTQPALRSVHPPTLSSLLISAVHCACWGDHNAPR